MRLIVCLMLSCLTLLFCAAGLWADDAEKYADYIKALEEINDKDLKNILIEEGTAFIYRFPAADQAEEIHFKIATIYHDSGEDVKSFFSHMQMLYLYPESSSTQVAKDRMRSLLLQSKKLKPISGKIEELLNPTLPDSTHEDAHFAFIQKMHDLRFEPVRSLLIQACSAFLQNFPAYQHSDAVLFWRGELQGEEGAERAAMADFLKLSHLHGSSLYVSAGQIKLARLMTETLKLHDLAIQTLNDFLLEFPEDPQAPQAQYQIAEIHEKKRKQHMEAIESYKAVAEKYPASLEAVPALFDAARLYEDRFDEHDKAIQTYLRVVQDFPRDIKAPYAFAEAARIYEDRLKDYANAASVYFKIYGNYPESSIAAQSLFAAAELNEEKVHDPDKAITYYRFVVDKYPNDKVAEKAAKRLEKLTKVSQKK